MDMFFDMKWAVQTSATFGQLYPVPVHQKLRRLSWRSDDGLKENKISLLFAERLGISGICDFVFTAYERCLYSLHASRTWGECACLNWRSPAWSHLLFGLNFRKVKEVLLEDPSVFGGSCGENSLKVKLVDIKAFFCSNSLWWHLEAQQTGHCMCVCVSALVADTWSAQLLNIKGC